MIQVGTPLIHPDRSIPFQWLLAYSDVVIASRLYPLINVPTRLRSWLASFNLKRSRAGREVKSWAQVDDNTLPSMGNRGKYALSLAKGECRPPSSDTGTGINLMTALQWWAHRLFNSDDCTWISTSYRYLHRGKLGGQQSFAVPNVAHVMSSRYTMFMASLSWYEGFDLRPILNVEMLMSGHHAMLYYMMSLRPPNYTPRIQIWTFERIERILVGTFPGLLDW